MAIGDTSSQPKVPKVYDWALQATKPTYKTDEITGLSTTLSTMSTAITAAAKAGLPEGGDTGQIPYAGETGRAWITPTLQADITLTAAAWVDGAQTVTSGIIKAPYTYGQPVIAMDATDEQVKAYLAAVPRVTAVSEGAMTVRATGKVPTVDIPLRLVVML